MFLIPLLHGLHRRLREEEDRGRGGGTDGASPSNLHCWTCTQQREEEEAPTVGASPWIFVIAADISCTPWCHQLKGDTYTYTNEKQLTLHYAGVTSRMVFCKIF